MTGPDLVEMLADTLQVPDLACTVERDPHCPGRLYVYLDGSILRLDVHEIAIHPARLQEAS